ncbi:hypothetical protein U1Q18_010756 [Sarracenia purpurea var. burkii]
MGFRKAAIAPPSDQSGENVNTCNGICNNGDVSAKKIKSGEIPSSPHQLKGHSVSTGISSVDHANSADPVDPSTKDDISGNVAKEGLGAKSSFKSKRKNSTLGSKNKRLKIENDDLIELKLTWEQAQGLLRPPPNHVPNVVVIEGFEFEEYEDAPIIGRPTIFATDHMGCVSGKIQWAQCEDCFKWRKLPADAFLPSRWTCFENLWDPERSLCSAAQELTAEQLEDLLPTSTRAASKKTKLAKEDLDSVESLDGLDALANLAIQEEGEAALPSSSQTTTKHPRHRPGCTCIVCIQPPSGKGPKHKQTCTCNVCLTVKRRFQTLMLRRERKQSEKESETAAHQKLLHHPFEKFPDDQKMGSGVDPDDDPGHVRSSLSPPFKGQIDLNIQPERDEYPSSGSDSSGTARLIKDATERYFGQQRLTSTSYRNSPAANRIQPTGVVIGGNFGNSIALSNSSILPDTNAECHVPLATIAPASTSGTERR